MEGLNTLKKKDDSDDGDDGGVGLACMAHLGLLNRS